MKTAVLIFAMIGIASADETSRKWTDTQGRSIEGKLVAKTDTTASVQLASSKVVELPIDKLDADSKAYVTAATLIKEIAPDDLVSARVSGMGKGKKTIEVVAKAGTKELTVVATVGSKVRGRYVIKPGDSKTFEFSASDEYIVTGSIDGKVVDTEDSRKKTGLGPKTGL